MLHVSRSDHDGTATSGSSFASFLLGYPTASDPEHDSGCHAAHVFKRYYAGYAQDDWRVTSNFTLNFGLRIEHEAGMREVEQPITVGFDQDAVTR